MERTAIRMSQAGQQEQHALRVLRRLEEATRHEFPTSIGAILILAAPAHIGEQRVKVAMAIAREIVAKKLGKKSQDLTYKEMQANSPYLVFNGNPREIREFERLLKRKKGKIHPDKVIIIRKVVEGRTKRPHRNTHDQIKSFTQQLANPDNELSNVQKVAIISHDYHFIRVPAYLQKFADEILTPAARNVQFVAHPIRSKTTDSKRLIKLELKKRDIYERQNDLSARPLNIMPLLAK